MEKAYFWEKLNDGKVKCTLCPHFCILTEGQKGLCLGRKNIDGSLTAINYGKVITIADDPIEKKPLYHYHPGTHIISVAQHGCNLKCPFCQNYNLSQEDHDSDFLSIEGLKAILDSHERKMVAFTYTEPFVWYEYIYDFGEKYKNQVDIILVTNGTINMEPLRKIAPYIKAANIDLKSFNSDFYKNELKGDLETVKNTIRTMHESGIHIEITNLLIPSKNDSIHEFSAMVEFIADISKEIPFHISRYYPNYKYHIYPTPIELIVKFYDLAKKSLSFVYIGNINDDEYSNTYCSNCRNILIKRSFYKTEIIGLKGKNCAECGNPINIIL